MAAVSRPLNGRMAETGPIKTGAQKEERKALAKIAALGALLTRQAGAFLALSCPTDEAAREAATRREKLLLIPSTSAGNKCLTGPPSTTLMHAWEKVAGELKQIIPWFQGLSRKCGSTKKAAEERIKIEQSVPGLKDALELSTYVMQQYNNHKKEQEAVWREKRAFHLLMYDANLCFVSGVAVVDPRTLLSNRTELLRRLNLYAFAREPFRKNAATKQAPAWLQITDDLEKEFMDLIIEMHGSFQEVVSPTPGGFDRRKIEPWDEQVAMDKAARTQSEPSGSAKTSIESGRVASSSARAPITSLVQMAAGILGAPGGLLSAKKVCDWVQLALGPEGKPHDSKVVTLRRAVEVAELWVEHGQGSAAPPVHEEIEQKMAAMQSRHEEKMRAKDNEIAELREKLRDQDKRLQPLQTPSSQPCVSPDRRDTLLRPANSSPRQSLDKRPAASTGVENESPQKKAKSPCKSDGDRSQAAHGHAPVATEARQG